MNSENTLHRLSSTEDIPKHISEMKKKDEKRYDAAGNYSEKYLTFV